MTTQASAGRVPKFAIVRLSTFDESALVNSAADVDEFQRVHASQPGYAGTITVDLGSGRQLAVNFWASEEDADVARESLRSTIEGLLGGVMTDSSLVGAGHVTQIDLPGHGAQPDPPGAERTDDIVIGNTSEDRRVPTLPRTMRAVVFHSPGGPEVLSVIELPVPQPNEGQVRVRVQAAPVFSADVAARSGAFGSMLPSRPYYSLGWDMAGTVDAVGAGVTGFAPGDSVIGMSNPMFSQAGTQAEYIVLDALELAPAPAGLSPAEASTIPANGLAALQALEALELVAGNTLAITGAAGAVGGYAAALAHQRGLRVLGVGSIQDEEFITGVGAEFVPRSDNPVEAIRLRVPSGVDGLLDAAAIGSAAIGAVRDGGAFIALIPPATPAPERDIRIPQMMVHSDAAQLRELVALTERGRLATRVARTFGFEEAAEAHAMFASGGVRGRLVLVP